MAAHGSRFWHAAFKLQYRILAIIDPLVGNVWRHFGIGNVVELEVAQRSGKGMRRRFIGVLAANSNWYVGHPDGEVGWTRDLRAAREGRLVWHDGREWRFRAQELPPGDEREAAIRSTGQHPFPGNLVYRLGRRHVRSTGVFFRLVDPA